MIQANELRVGNLVLLNNPVYRPIDTGQIHLINAITKEYASVSKLTKEPFTDTYGQYLQYIEGIPITTEWLLKFRFKKKLNDNKVSYNKHNIIIHFVNGIFTEYVHQKQIKYVHKLQNLFFEIRGVELSGF